MTVLHAFLNPSEGITHDVSDDGENLILRTNLDAVDFRIVTVPFTKPLSSDWHEIVSHVEAADQVNAFV